MTGKVSQTGGPVVTIDGPAGSGKSTTAREVARRTGLRHLDSGALYRGMTWALLETGVPEERWDRLRREELDRLGVGLEPGPEGFRIRVGDRALEGELREARVTARVSRVAGFPAVREWLLPVLRGAAGAGGVVADGRDLGSVVFPDADLKVFVTAELEERARRRILEEGCEPTPVAVAEEARRLAERDRSDSERPVAPLIRPDDAVVVDTTHLAFDEQVRGVVERIEALRGDRGGGPRAQGRRARPGREGRHRTAGGDPGPRGGAEGDAPGT